MIEENPNWELFCVYTDEGVSGTGVTGRAAFSEMLTHARQGKFDVILTKEVSRFARNTVDTLSITRELRALGVRVLFVNDAIDTYSGDGEFRLAIMASVAQEESRKTSERVRFGIYRQMEQGFVFGRSVYGYELKEGILHVNEQEAAVVKNIFFLAMEGKNCEEIASVLRSENAPKGRFMKEWKGHTVRKILRNEKYCGDLVQRKTCVVDYLTHKAKINRGHVPYVVQQNHHTPIIDRSIFLCVNEKTARKRENGTKKTCGYCGATLRNKGKTSVGKTRYYCRECKRSFSFFTGQNTQTGP